MGSISAESFISGFAYGGTTVLVGQPFETIKTLRQVQSASSATTAAKGSTYFKQLRIYTQHQGYVVSTAVGYHYSWGVGLWWVDKILAMLWHVYIICHSYEPTKTCSEICTIRSMQHSSANFRDTLWEDWSIKLLDGMYKPACCYIWMGWWENFYYLDLLGFHS